MPKNSETVVWQLEDVMTQKIINIYKPKVILGRSREADIVCTFIAASRAHAEFTLCDGQLRVADLDSLNGILINKQRIPPEVPLVLNIGDEVAIADDGLVNDDEYRYFKVGKMSSSEIITLEISDDEDQSLNGTYVNKQKIPSGIPRVLDEGDEVAIGEDGTVTEEYKNFKVGKMTTIDTITVESSDDEDISHKEGPVLDDRREKPCDSDEAICIEQTVENEKISEQEIEQTEASPSSNKANVENNVQNDQLLVNIKIEERPVASSINDLASNHLTSERKTAPQSALDEEIIVIVDDDDEDAVMLSQLLAANDDSAPNERQPVTDDIFYKIKKEVEEFDKVECQEWEYPCVIDSDAENENLSEIFAEELKEFDTNKQSDPSPPSPKAVLIENKNISYGKELNKQTNSPSSSPLAAPVANGNISPEVFYNRKPSSTMLIEPQPLKIQNNRKRKSDSKKKEDSNKKQRRNSSAETNSRNVPQEHCKRKKEKEKVDDRRVCKEEKRKIVEIRKEKLKELAIKSTENKSSESKLRVNKPKVKVSEGRGNFLLSNIEAVPSTSKAKDIPPKPITNSRDVSKRPHDQKRSVVRPELVNKNIRVDATESWSQNIENRNVKVDTTDEVKEILSWNTVWLARSEYLTLNPVVRLKNLKQLEKSYLCYNDYFEMNRSLLMVELWAHIQREFELNRSNCVFPMFVEECEHDNKTDIWTLHCLTYLTKIQAESLTSVRDSDLLVIDLRLTENGRALIKPSFGFVQDCTKCILRNHHYINAGLAGRLDAMPHTKISLRVLINRRPVEQIKTKTIVNFKIVTSLVPHLRLFKSLRYLEHSPLINIILKPRLKDFTLSDVNVDTLTSKDKLSSVQFTAVMEAVCVCSRPEPGLYLIQGPPGTGKTNIIKNIVLQLLYGKHKIQNGCILLVAPSNAAVDQLVLKLVYDTKPKLSVDQKKNMKLVRVGPESSIHTRVKLYCLEELAKRNLTKDLFSSNAEAAERHKGLLREIEALESEIEKLKVKNKGVTHLRTKLESLKSHDDNFAKDLLRERYNQVFGQNCDTILCGANIICTTLSSCMGRRIEDNVLSGRLRFVCCIVDEATQSTEQESLIPLRLGVKRMVLVGDPQQLPATVMSPDAKLLGYGCSLFQRILENFSKLSSKPLKMLNKQYRMHPEICKFPNKQYYGGKLESNFKYTKPLQTLHPFLIFRLNVPYNNHRKQEMYKNADEACFIRKLIEALLDTIPHGSNVSVGIITPYQNQRATIDAELKGVKCRDDVSIKCNTVDSFQGQETDITILSCVRAEANTFLNDAHRLNVALTRAKYALYVVGTKSLFDDCAELAKLRQNAEERRLLRDGTRLKCDDLKKILWK